jgi:hypothetical protein
LRSLLGCSAQGRLSRLAVEGDTHSAMIGKLNGTWPRRLPLQEHAYVAWHTIGIVHDLHSNLVAKRL